MGSQEPGGQYCLKEDLWEGMEISIHFKNGVTNLHRMGTPDEKFFFP